MTWKQLDRKTIVDTKFLKVYADKIELPNGAIIDDYTVIEKPSFVMVVATDKDNNIVTLREYRYAVNETLNTLPAGNIDKDESPLVSAKRELQEETGYTADTWEELGYFYDYPTKDCHKGYFFRAINARKTDMTHHEDTESIDIRITSIPQLKTEVKKGEWKANAALAALLMANIFS